MNVTGLVKATNNFLQALMQLALQPAGTTSAPGPLVNAFLALLNQPPGFTPAMDASKLTEASFPGYARKKLAFGAVALDSTGRVSTPAASLSFAPTDSTTSQGVKGLAIFDAATGGNLLAVCALPAEFTFARPTDTLSVVVTLSVPPGNLVDWGNAVAIR